MRLVRYIWMRRSVDGERCGWGRGMDGEGYVMERGVNGKECVIL